MKKISDDILEQVAEKIHKRWATKRIEEGWTYGPKRDDLKKETPCLVDYHLLPEIEKEYDRATARITIESLFEMGYDIVKREKGEKDAI